MWESSNRNVGISQSKWGMKKWGMKMWESANQNVGMKMWESSNRNVGISQSKCGNHPIKL